MMNMVTSCLLSSWWDFYQGAVRVWRGWPRSRARADLIRICDRFNVSLRKSDWKATSEQVADGDGESGRMARTGQGSTIPRTPWVAMVQFDIVAIFVFMFLCWQIGVAHLRKRTIEKIQIAATVGRTIRWGITDSVTELRSSKVYVVQISKKNLVFKIWFFRAR